MKIVDFKKVHVEGAKLIAAANYYEERKYVPILPSIDVLPDFEYFASNGLGVAAFDDDQLIGFYVVMNHGTMHLAQLPREPSHLFMPMVRCF